MRNKDKTNTMPYPTHHGSISHLLRDLPPTKGCRRIGNWERYGWDIIVVFPPHTCPVLLWGLHRPRFLSGEPAPVWGLHWLQFLPGITSTGYNSCKKHPPAPVWGLQRSHSGHVEPSQVPLPSGEPAPAWGLHRPRFLPGIVPLLQHLLLAIFTNPSAHSAVPHHFLSPHHSSWLFLSFINHVRCCQRCCWLRSWL